MIRKPPEIKKTPLADGHRFLCSYFDSIQEAFAYVPLEAVVEELDDARHNAQEAAPDGSGLWGITWGPESLQVRSTGATGGFKWVLGNDDFLILVKSRNCDWGVSVRYLSAGLWEHGYEALRARVDAILENNFERRQDDAVRLSRIDVACDFYLPGFELRPSAAEYALLPSRCKVGTIGSDGKLQTLTFGTKSTLEVQLYDKAREIREASGKEWFYALWEREGLPAGVREDVWRLEVRFAGEWLKERDIRTFQQYAATGGKLVSEALVSRRLCIPNGDSNRARLPMHPIWSSAWENAAHCWPEYVPLGRHVTGRRDKLIDQAMKQIAGSMRTLQVLKDKDCAPVLDDYLVQQIAWDAYEIAAAAKGTPEKIAQIKERYKFVEEPR